MVAAVSVAIVQWQLPSATRSSSVLMSVSPLAKGRIVAPMAAEARVAFVLSPRLIAALRVSVGYAPQRVWVKCAVAMGVARAAEVAALKRAVLKVSAKPLISAWPIVARASAVPMGVLVRAAAAR